MNHQEYAVVLRHKVDANAGPEVVSSLVSQLGVKEKTAQQIIKHIPLKVYGHLSFGEARILVEALNIVTRCQWELMLESEVNFAAANWNKKPTIMGMSLEDLMRKNHPQITGVAKYLTRESEASRNSSKGLEQGDAVLPEMEDGDSSEEKALDSADTVIKNLSADLEKVIDQVTGPEVMQTQVLSAMPGGLKGQELSSAQPLEKGFYNLYLPELSDEEKSAVIDVARESLGMDEAEVMSVLSKSIPCITRNVDEEEAQRVIEIFRSEGIKLKNRLRSKA